MNESEIICNEKNNSLENREYFRALIKGIEAEILSVPGALIGDSPKYLEVCPLKHTFVDDAYVREIFLPKDMFFTTKIHMKTHPYFIMSGDVSVLTEDGFVRIKGPFHGITKGGTKRFIYTHEDTVWITVHATKEQDLKKIEEELIASSFEAMDNEIIDVLEVSK